MTEKVTLGKILFPGSLPEGVNPSTIEDHIWKTISDANSINEFEERIFVLKLESGNILAKSAILQKVFERLTNFDPMISGVRKLYLERIGRVALEVFFEAVFERNKEAFWSYLASTPDNCNWVDRYGKDAAAALKETFMDIEKNIFSFPIYPRSLAVYLNYFSACSEATKREHKAKIKKFLKYVLDEPLDLSYKGTKAQVGISQWSEKARHELACALVVNGMYEECLDYNIHEALKPMTIKFCGGQKEGEDGLTRLTEADAAMDATQALEKACEDKEWGHMWSVITRLAFKSGIAEFLYYRPQMHESPAAVQAKLALVWQYPVLRYSLDPEFIGL